MNKTKSKIEPKMVVFITLEPFSFVRKDLAENYMKTVDLIKGKVFEETIRTEPESWGYTDKHLIKFFICSPHKDKKDAESPLQLLRVVTVAPEDERYITITSSISFDKASLKEESLKNLLADLLADLDSKAFRLFMKTPDIFMSKPYLLSIEVNDTTVKVKIGMYALDYYKYCVNDAAGVEENNSNV